MKAPNNPPLTPVKPARHGMATRTHQEATRSDGTAWADCPDVVIHKAACPACWADEYTIVRSEANGDGSTTRKAICGSCGQRFKIIVEPLPEIGNE